MAFLPKEKMVLSGGCFCKAVRYTIHIPDYDQRPIIPQALPTPVSDSEEVETRLPVIDLDHCQTCRQVSGNIIQCWIICPAAWVSWQLLTSTEQTLHQSTLEAIGPGQNDETVLRKFNATDVATRTFCGRCGTNLTYLSHKRPPDKTVVDITVGSLDDHSLAHAKPDRHGWWNSGTD